jgi:hypothetical protein
MSIIPAQEKAAVAHFEVEEKLKVSEGHSLAPTTTVGTDGGTGYAGSFLGATHKEEVRRAERKLVFKLGGLCVCRSHYIWTDEMLARHCHYASCVLALFIGIPRPR